MVIDDQREVLELLGRPRSHGESRPAVERIETHASVVFLAGNRALKLKRAVRYDYLDFSTPDLRRRCCEAEVALNRRTAPALYRGVVAITRQPDGTLAIGGTGEPIEWLVDMARFDQSRLLDRLAARNALPLGLMPELAAAIARLHEVAVRRPDKGGADGMRWIVEGNRRALERVADQIGGSDAVTRLLNSTDRALAAAAPLVEQRRHLGFVRQCHGDLHLRNIVALDDGPTLFDAIEFNDDISCADVVYDLAFLLMDLWRRDLRAHANLVFNEYLRHTGDLGSLSLLPFFLSCRAAVRAKTSAAAATLQPDAGAAAPLWALARQYVRWAQDFLTPPAATIVSIGGLSGTGKSTQASALGPHVGPAPGAVHLSSDVIRKSLFGVAPTSRLPPSAYDAEVSARVYRRLADDAAVTLASGHGVVADAVFGRLADRQAIEAVAGAAGVPFVGVWLRAPADSRVWRVGRRTGGESDATAAVVERQEELDTGQVTWREVDAGSPIEVVAAAVRRLADGAE